MITLKHLKIFQLLFKKKICISGISLILSSIFIVFESLKEFLIETGNHMI